MASSKPPEDGQRSGSDQRRGQASAVQLPSLALQMPKSASVQQLVRNWEVTASPDAAASPSATLRDARQVPDSPTKSIRQHTAPDVDLRTMPPAEHLTSTALKPALLSAAPAHSRDGLARSSDGQAIFDLEGTSPRAPTSWLPSVFRQGSRFEDRSATTGVELPATKYGDGMFDEAGWENSMRGRTRSKDDDTMPLVTMPSPSSRDNELSQGSQRGSSMTLAAYRPPSPTKLSGFSEIAYQLDRERLPVPADEVFAAAAPPLNLPALEEYLANTVLFAPPHFSDSNAVCTQEERDLFGIRDGVQTFDAEQNARIGSRIVGSRFDGIMGSRGSTTEAPLRRAPFLEVAGAQLSLPVQAVAAGVEATGNGPRGWRSGAGLRSRIGKYARLRGQDREDDNEELEAIKETRTRSDRRNGRVDDALDNYDDAKTVVSSSADSSDGGVLRKVDTAHSGASKRPSMPPTMESDFSLPASSGVSSQISTASQPVSRLEMFPPLMLLKENSLDELKSNAIGPRKPPGGIWAVSILGTVFDLIIGVEGSNFAAGLFRLELFRDFLQMMALSLHFIALEDPVLGSDKALKFLLQTLPSLLGLNLVSVFGYAIIIFLVWMGITAVALWRFWQMTRAYDPNRNVEGFDSPGWIYKTSSRGQKLLNTTTVFVLSTLYLPLSKLAVDALVWSSDFWPVPNPYVGGNDRPVLVPLGNADTWRDPHDFCYTTTMRRDGFNWAYVIVPAAALTFCFYTLWFPWRMMTTIRGMLPKVAEYNELGNKRTPEEMEIEYARLLDRDKSPLNFLYNTYRRRWAFYKPLYLVLFKLSNLIIIGALSKDTCLFRSVPTRTILVAQQVTLIVTMSMLLGIHVWLKPFVDQISNRSEMVSRVAYVCTAILGLLVALRVPASTVYNTAILLFIQAVSYTWNIYFAAIGTSVAAHRVKRWQKRVDFSIDIFSPLLDLQKHIKRRVWQETLSIILLSGRGLRMPLDQVIAFAMSETDSYAPYLLDFQGSVAERHVENLKIVKQIGLDEYQGHVRYSRTAPGQRLKELARIVQKRYAGPDAYYRPTQPPFPSGVSSYFGKAFLVPFPPTIVMRYDQGSEITHQIDTLEGFEAFVQQNGSDDVRSRRRVRKVLRALEGQRVLCPHVENVLIGSQSGGLRSRFTGLEKRRGRYSRPSAQNSDLTMVMPVSYIEATLHIERRQEHEWKGYNFSSGFYVQLVYDQGRRQESSGAVTTVRKTVKVAASRAIGLHDDFVMTPSLARFFKNNESLIKERMPHVERVVQRYRCDFAREGRRKEEQMPYSFETDVFDNHLLSPQELCQTLTRTVAPSSTLSELPQRYKGCLTMMYERLEAINRSPVHRYWWLLFDEIWRMNSEDYPPLRTHRRCFSPQFPSSIAYTPMTRAGLERFLAKRGLWKRNGRSGGPFNRGLLNRIYFYLNEIVFAGHHSGLSTFRPPGFRADDRPPPPPTSPPSPAQPGTDAWMGSPDGHGLIHIGFGTTPQNATRRPYPSFDNLKREPSRPPTEGKGGGAASPDGEERNGGYVPNVDSRLTGGGTVYSMSSIRDRSAYVWEQRMDGRPLSTWLQRSRIRLMQWLNLAPVMLDLKRERLFLYVKLVGGGDHDRQADGRRYELLLQEGCGHR